MLVSYADSITMRDARHIYFEANRFGADGGYNDAWVDFKLGPIPMPFKNTAGRVRAVRFHDLHHILTAYDTDIIGEFEISAWEIGAGCKGFVAAWALNLGGMAGGLLSAPRRTFRAFVRGLRSRSLYGEPFEPLLDQNVGELRAHHIDGADGSKATALEGGLFVVASAAGLAVGTTLFAMMLPLIPVGLVARRLRQADTTRAA